MRRIILGDSSLELTEKMNKDLVKTVPFFIDIDDKQYKDDGSINQAEFLNAMKSSTNTPQTAAPSPNSFYESMKGMDEVYVVTISSKLSTTYNNAIIAADMIKEESPETKIHVFDSYSAVSGETAIAIKLEQLLKEGISFKSIVEETEKFIKNMNTFFVLEDLSNLIKNGRMSKLSGALANALSIYPICSEKDGEIIVLSKPRGVKSAIKKLVSTIGDKFTEDSKKRTLVISHVDNLATAEEIKNLILEKYEFKNIEIVGAKGLSSTYANKGGIVVAF